jgi:hypothetical protein
MRCLPASLVALVATSTVVAGLAAPALAAPAPTDQTLDKVRQALQLEVDRRQTETGSLQNEVNASKYLTADHKSALAGEITTADTGLSGVEGQIAGADLATLKTLRQQMVGLRVFVVLTPKVHETIVDDAEQQALAAFAKADPKLATAITTAQGNGKDVTAAQAALDDMRAKVADATSSIAGLDTTIAGFEPAGFPGIQDSVKQTRVKLGTAKNDLVAARADAKTVISDLKA